LRKGKGSEEEGKARRWVGREGSKMEEAEVD